MFFRAIALRAPAVRVTSPIAARAFSISVMQRMPAQSEVANNDPSTLEKGKNEQLGDGQHPHSPHPKTAPGFNEELASDSEAAIKGDNNDHKGPPTEQLQKETVEHTHKKHGQ